MAKKSRRKANANANAKPVWLDREQRIGLSNIFVGYSIGGGLSLASYMGGKLDVTAWDAVAMAFGLVGSVYLALMFRKERS